MLTASPDPLLEKNDPPLAAKLPSETMAFVRGLLGDLRNNANAPSWPGATLEAVRGGRHAVSVLKVNPHSDGTRVQGVPFIVKIVPSAIGGLEKANYARFVRKLVPGRNRPDLLGFAVDGDLAALCYSFVGSGHGKPLPTLTDCLQNGDEAALGIVASDLLIPLWGSWYGPRISRSRRDIAHRYLERYFTRSTPNELESCLRAHASSYFGAKDREGDYRIGSVRFPHVGRILFETVCKRRYRSSLLHGDLNSDNVLIDPEEARAVMIDFEKTGRGHVFEDLIALEMSVRINFPQHESFDQIMEIEHSLASRAAATTATLYSEQIRAIRARSRDFFAFQDAPWEYAFAVAAIGLRLMQATDLLPFARARIVASALWAARALASAPAEPIHVCS
jgi:hypothetical protein